MVKPLGKNTKILFFGLSLIKRGPPQLVWLQIGSKHIFRQSFPDTSWKIFSVQMILDYFFNNSQHRHYIWRGGYDAGSEHSKVHFTRLATSNFVGKKIPMFIIGKSETWRCFKGVKSLPCQCESQKKAWMYSSFWTVCSETWCEISSTS